MFFISISILAYTYVYKAPPPLYSMTYTKEQRAEDMEQEAIEDALNNEINRVEMMYEDNLRLGIE